jgi:hypothetical protein
MMGGFVFIGAAAVLIIIILVLIMTVAKKYRAKIKEKLLETKKKLMWNDTIKSNNVSYLPTALTLFAKVTMLRNEFNYSDLATCLVLTILLVV